MDGIILFTSFKKWIRFKIIQYWPFGKGINQNERTNIFHTQIGPSSGTNFEMCDFFFFLYFMRVTVIHNY